MHTLKNELNMCTEQTLITSYLSRHKCSIHKSNISLLKLFVLEWVYWMSFPIALDASWIDFKKHRLFKIQWWHISTSRYCPTILKIFFHLNLSRNWIPFVRHTCKKTGLGKKIIPLEGKSYHSHNSCIWEWKLESIKVVSAAQFYSVQ